MARLVFGMNQSLDGYVDHDGHPDFVPDSVLFRHFIDQVGGAAGSVYGRRLYEIMRYWDDEHPEWSAAEREFAEAWRKQHKWVVSRTLTSVGPNATLISNDVEAAVRKLKAGHSGVIELGGPVLAQSLTDLIDEYQIYLHPVVLGHGNPFFKAARPPLRLVANEVIGNAIRLTYIPV